MQPNTLSWIRRCTIRWQSTRKQIKTIKPEEIMSVWLLRYSDPKEDQLPWFAMRPHWKYGSSLPWRVIRFCTIREGYRWRSSCTHEMGADHSDLVPRPLEKPGSTTCSGDVKFISHLKQLSVGRLVAWNWCVFQVDRWHWHCKAHLWMFENLRTHVHADFLQVFLPRSQTEWYLYQQMSVYLIMVSFIHIHCSGNRQY